MEVALSALDMNGLAALSDLTSTQWKENFRKLDLEQNEFLKHDAAFRPAAYPWPRDALHTWSRMWEYPYIYHHITECALAGTGAGSRIVDVGSGITFFPVSLARTGANVHCLDVDPVCVAGMTRAAELVGLGTGSVTAARTVEEKPFPVDDESVDVVYSISVLEHTPDPTRVLAEMIRVLKPGGYLALTIDIDLRGDAAIGPGAYRELTDFLAASLKPCHSHRSIHPLEALTSCNSPYSVHALSGSRAALHALKQAVKPLFGRRRIPNPPYMLAVEGMCYRKD